MVKSAEPTPIIFYATQLLICSGIASRGMVSLVTATVGYEEGFTERPGDGGCQVVEVIQMFGVTWGQCSIILMGFLLFHQ